LRAGALRGSELALRVCSALVLVPLAIGTAYLGGWPFALFWGAAAIGVLWEWSSLVARHEHFSALLAGGASLALAVVLVATGHVLPALIVVAMGALGAASLTLAERRTWVAGGIAYAGVLAIGPIILRSDGASRDSAVLFLAIVWTTDIGASFRGGARRPPTALGGQLEQDLCGRHWGPARLWRRRRRRRQNGGADVIVCPCHASGRVICLGAGGRPFRVLSQAPVRCQSFASSHSRPRRTVDRLDGL
jgi:hypothetical protein